MQFDIYFKYYLMIYNKRLKKFNHTTYKQFFRQQSSV